MKRERKKTVSEEALENDFYRKLAAAVVLDAVKDYKSLLHRWLKHPKYRRSRSEIRNKRILEEFFHSEWGLLLSGIHGDKMIRFISKRVREEKLDSLGVQGAARRKINRMTHDSANQLILHVCDTCQGDVDRQRELLERILFNTLECPESGFKEKGALSNNGTERSHETKSCE